MDSKKPKNDSFASAVDALRKVGIFPHLKIQSIFIEQQQQQRTSNLKYQVKSSCCSTCAGSSIYFFTSITRVDFNFSCSSFIIDVLSSYCELEQF